MTARASLTTGWPRLLQVAVRLDRLRTAAWVVAIAGLVLVTAASFRAIYPDPAELRVFADSIRSNPAFLALVGPLFDTSSLGAVTAWRTGGFGPTLTGLMSLLMVVRHTRAEEELGRFELVGAAVVGRLAWDVAALVELVAVNAVIAAAVTCAMVSQRMGLVGGVALGLGFAMTGCVFGCLALLLGQFSESARTAASLSGSVLASAFVLRAAGDSVGGSGNGPSLGWLSWLSPVGWSQQLRPYADERWWVLAIGFAAAGGLAAWALSIQHRRDLGAAVIRPGPAPDRAHPRLSPSWGLTWRLNRGFVRGWAIGFVVFGGILGALAQSVGDLLASSPRLREIFDRLGLKAGDLADRYLASVYGLLGLVAAGFAMALVLRMHSEESAFRAELLLSGELSRRRWLTSYVVAAGLSAAAILGAAGLGSGVVHGLRTHDLQHQILPLVTGALVQWPAAMVLMGIAVAAYGWAPLITSAAWAALAACVFLSQFGPSLRLDPALIDLSPYSHLPVLPGGDFDAKPVLLLTLIALALVVAGERGLARRDVA